MEIKKLMKKIKNNPLVSLIIPYQNQQQMITSLLQSILTQNQTNVECIFINDHSTDGTSKVVESFCKHHSISSRHLSLVHTTGEGQAIKYALDYSNGVYMMALSPFVILQPHAIEQFISIIPEKEEKGQNVVAAYADQRLFQTYSKYRYIGEKQNTTIKEIKDIFCESFWPSPVLFNIEAIKETGGWPVDFLGEGKYFSELVVLANLFSVGRFIHIPQVLSFYLQASIEDRMRKDYSPVLQVLMRKVFSQIQTSQEFVKDEKISSKI